MELKIVLNEELQKNGNKWFLKNFKLVEEDEKMFLCYHIDREKQMRIYFKNTLLQSEKREHIKKVWSTGEGIDELISSFWLVKSNQSGVLLFVPIDTEQSDKSGVFILVLTKSFFHPSPIYFKRSFKNGMSISLFYSTSKNIILLLGENYLNLVYNTDNNIIIKKYVEDSLHDEEKKESIT